MSTKIGTADFTYSRDIDPEGNLTGTTTIYLYIDPELGDVVTNFQLNNHFNFDIQSCELVVWSKNNSDLKTQIQLESDIELPLLAMDNVCCYIKIIINDENGEVTDKNCPRVYATYTDLDDEEILLWFNSSILINDHHYIEGICHTFNGTPML